MIKSMNNLIINDLVKQNPWWVDPQAKAIDPAKIHRDIFETLKERILHRELITSLSGTEACRKIHSRPANHRPSVAGGPESDYAFVFFL